MLKLIRHLYPTLVAMALLPIAACSFDSESARSLPAVLKGFNAINDPRQWAGFWEDVGNGNIKSIEDLTLSAETQEAAAQGLAYTIRENTRQPATSRWNEKVFLPIMDKVFSRKTTYYKAYSELANHALNRDHKVGVAMYGYIPDDPEVIAAIVPAAAMLSYHFREQHEQAIEYAAKVLARDNISPDEEGIARLVDLESRLNLQQADACAKILATDEKNFANKSHQDKLAKLKEKCQGEP